MGVLLDSSVIIAAERLSQTAETFLDKINVRLGDQQAALSAVGYTELVHGLYRADNDPRRTERQTFLSYLLSELPVHPYNQQCAEIAGKIDAQSRVRHVVIPFPDLLIGATALSLGFSVLTINVRHFRLIPGLTVIPF